MTIYQYNISLNIIESLDCATNKNDTIPTKKPLLQGLQITRGAPLFLAEVVASVQFVYCRWLEFLAVEVESFA